MPVFAGKYLRIDLTDQTWHEVEIPEEDVKTWFLCSVYAARRYYQEMDPNVQPLDPANPLYVFNGVLAGTFAPTRAIWSFDNRTAGYRLCGAKSKAVRIECRVGGADLNPYLAFAALLAAGLDGVENSLELEKPFSGDAYKGKRLREIPKTLREATDLMDRSRMLRQAFGDVVVDHYVHTARWEQFEYDRRVTDWEIRRGFEQY